ncbi:MAG TPA: GNAT family N-acetyltransferase [Conexibacter sp.]|jgi:GNAT superfamily N-acetyltransferase|nr:GNAT family N-acetyltransferase [Conexibacter sp.]
MASPCDIRPATRDDVPLLLELIGELADYERLRDEVVLDAGLLERHLFGERPAAEAVLAEIGGEPVGYALFFPTFSTFLGRPGIWLEDLFVRPARRGAGVGRALLVHLAGLAVARDCGRLEWSALDWNEPALAFYRGIGARRMPEWHLHRLDGAALGAVAGRTGD